MSTVTTIAPEAATTAAKVLPSGPAPPATLVIFGAGGDLTKRLVVPALVHLVQAGKLPDEFAVIGVDHNEQTSEHWRQNLTKITQAFTQAGLDERAWSWLTSRMRYMPGDFTRSETFSRLEKLLAEREEQGNTSNALFYLAVADRFFGPVIEQLGHAGLTRQSDRTWRRVIVEKPFGHNLASAKALNVQILKVLSEDQIYRIDHFLGKETVQNILVLRFANGIFEPLWNRDHVDHVQITAAETVGVESRGRFYERTGALRERRATIQRHLRPKPGRSERGRSATGIPSLLPEECREHLEDPRQRQPLRSRLVRPVRLENCGYTGLRPGRPGGRYGRGEGFRQ